MPRSFSTQRACALAAAISNWAPAATDLLAGKAVGGIPVATAVAAAATSASSCLGIINNSCNGTCACPACTHRLNTCTTGTHARPCRACGSRSPTCSCVIPVALQSCGGCKTTPCTCNSTPFALKACRSCRTAPCACSATAAALRLHTFPLASTPTPAPSAAGEPNPRSLSPLPRLLRCRCGAMSPNGRCSCGLPNALTPASTTIPSEAAPAAAWGPHPFHTFMRAFSASSRAAFSSSSDQDELSKEVEQINALFVEARDEIEYAQEDSETTYFNESVAEAKKCVDSCLERWSALLARLPEAEAQKLQRSMGLKMEQLKAEFDTLSKTHLED